MRHALMCYAHGTDGDWEAICVDLDIAVQARSLREVKDCLDEAIHSYVEDALQEAPEVRDRLLNRRAPWHVRFGLAAKFFLYSQYQSMRARQEQQASFALPCPA